MNDTIDNKKHKLSISHAELEKQRAIYKVCKDAFDQEWSRADSLDSKARIFLVVIGLEINALGYVINQIEKIIPSLNINHVIIIFSLLVVAILAISFLLIALSTTLKKFIAYPELSEITTKFINDHEFVFLISISNYYQETIKANKKSINRKENLIKWGSFFSILGFLLIVSFYPLLVISSI